MKPSPWMRSSQFFVELIKIMNMAQVSLKCLLVCSFLQGCGFRELGVKVNNERRIPDKDITSSSQRDSNHAAFRGRVGIEAIGSWQDGWCSSGTDETPYIQVFFGKSSFFN